MYNRKKRLISIQICAFLIVSLAAIVLFQHFPNMPPFVRSFLPRDTKGSVKLNAGDRIPDARFLEWFNRDPERRIPQGRNLVVSPADGFIWALNEVEGAKHIVIEMRYTDVHVQRIPMDGEVIAIEGDGKKLEADYLVADYMLEKMMPYQKVTTLETEIGLVKIRQITSFFAKRIEVYPKLGDNVKRGERLGKVLAGSTIVLEVPNYVEILVKENENVLGGETIIGTY